MTDTRSIGNTAERRVKYGLNVAATIALSVAIVIILNVIAYKYLLVARFDATHSRQYSLSKQTRKIITNLENDYRIVTLIVRSNEYFDHAKDLIEEYDYHSGHVSVEHLSPRTSRGDVFFKKVMDRYENELNPLRDAIDRGRKALQEARQVTAQQNRPLDETSKDAALTDAKKRMFIDDVIRYLRLFQEETQNLDQVIENKIKTSLPDLTGSLGILRKQLEELEKNLDTVAIFFRNWMDDPSIAESLKSRLGSLAKVFEQLRDALQEPLQALRGTSESSEFNDVRRQLATPDTVVILGKDRVRVIELRDMFRAPDERRDPRDTQQPTAEVAFTGEEQITGAILSMELKKKPLVVIVSSGPQPAVAPGGAYSLVAERLRNMNFEVRSWSPTSAPQQFGPPRPPQPPPEPEAGQKVVWIVPPRPQADPRMPQASPGGERIAATIKESLDKGHGLMIMFAANQATMFGAPDPLAQLTESWGIKPNVGKKIMREVLTPNRQKVAQGNHVIRQWSDESSITAAIPGMRGLFYQPSALELNSSVEQKTTHTVLAKVTGRRLWEEDNLFDQNPSYKEKNAADDFLVAVAAQQGEQRMVVVADPYWATDQVTRFLGVMFPANAELFVNSVYWLAGMDELIAAGARTQDIRRVQEISNASLAALQWGLPTAFGLAALGIGIGVWLARRSV